MQFLLSIFFSLFLATATPEIAEVRIDYREAANSEETTKKLFDELSSTKKNDIAVLVAYKGAVTTLMSRYTEGFKEKKSFFKEGRDLLEYALETEPENVEIRCIRLSVQENAPKITGYKKNIDEDKQFILDNFALMTDQGAKNFVRGYVAQSEAFSEGEKQLF